MSRLNVAKSRADKSGSKIALTTSTPVTHDIVPGKFTDFDWFVPLLMIAIEAALFLSITNAINIYISGFIGCVSKLKSTYPPKFMKFSQNHPLQ